MADDTVQTDVAANPAPVLPVLDPNGTLPADAAPLNPAPYFLSPAPIVDVVDEPASAPIVDTESEHFRRFRKLWNGGERRLASELATVGLFAEAEYAALLGEFPELLDVLNNS